MFTTYLRESSATAEGQTHRRHRPARRALVMIVFHRGGRATRRPPPSSPSMDRTDITVTQAAASPEEGGQFVLAVQFGAEDARPPTDDDAEPVDPVRLPARRPRRLRGDAALGTDGPRPRAGCR